jgi:hypothetical protein
LWRGAVSGGRARPKPSHRTDITRSNATWIKASTRDAASIAEPLAGEA